MGRKKRVASLSSVLKALSMEYTNHLKENLAERLISVVLFGSVARGEAVPVSDIDLLIVVENPPSGRRARLELLAEADKRLEPKLKELEKLGIYTDFTPIIKSRDEALNFSPLYLDMVEDALILHDQDDFFGQVLTKLKDRLSLLKAKRLKQGQVRYWDLKPDFTPGEEFEL